LIRYLNTKIVSLFMCLVLMTLLVHTIQPAGTALAMAPTQAATSTNAAPTLTTAEMKMARRVLLDHEPQRVRRHDLRVVTGWLCGLREVAHLLIFTQLDRGHAASGPDRLLNDRDATTIPLHDLSRFRRTRV